MENERDELVFIVRMWQQGGEAGGSPQWRGSIHEIASGARFYVIGAADVADFIGAKLNGRSRA